MIKQKCYQLSYLYCFPFDSNTIMLWLFQMIAAIELENSLKSDHEIRAEQDRINVEIMKTGEADELDIEEASKQTAVEFEDACSEDLKDFKSTWLDKGTPKHIEMINLAFIIVMLIELYFLPHLIMSYLQGGDQYRKVLNSLTNICVLVWLSNGVEDGDYFQRVVK